MRILFLGGYGDKGKKVRFFGVGREKEKPFVTVKFDGLKTVTCCWKAEKASFFGNE